MSWSLWWVHTRQNIGSVAACMSVVGNCATHLTLFGGIIHWTWDCKLYKRIHCKGHLVGYTFSKLYFTLWWVRLCNCIIQHSALAVLRYQHLCALSCYLMIPPCHSVQPDGLHWWWWWCHDQGVWTKMMAMIMIMIMVMIRRTLIIIALYHSVQPAGLDW